MKSSEWLLLLIPLSGNNLMFMPSVSYRIVRRRQLRGAKLPGQCNLILQGWQLNREKPLRLPASTRSGARIE
jgi:hypothetical protein